MLLHNIFDANIAIRSFMPQLSLCTTENLTRNLVTAERGGVPSLCTEGKSSFELLKGRAGSASAAFLTHCW